MQITNCGRGIHKREIPGIDVLKKNLPDTFYAYTNLDLVLGVGRAREIDVIVVTERRIFVVDLKDWHGRITSSDGRWLLDGKERDPSPVKKVTEIARELAILLKSDMAKRVESKDLPVPRIEGLVVLTGAADRSGIAETERAKVLTIGEFQAAVGSARSDRDKFGNVAAEFLSEPLTSPIWKGRLKRFFNANPSGALRPGKRRFHRFVPEELSSFEHPRQIYREYDAREDGSPPSYGTLRLWDFTKIDDTRFQTEEGRLEIAGRERRIYHWLRDRSDVAEKAMLTPRVDDHEEGVSYWEIFDRRKRMKRLSDFAATEVRNHTAGELLELARQLLASLAEFHRHSAAHLDLGGHSVWLEAPTTVRFSHLFAARYPEVRSLGESRYNFLASASVPEDILGSGFEPFRRDVFLAANAVHQILFGAAPAGDPPEWDPSIDVDGRYEVLHDWFAEALDFDVAQRFRNAREALESYNAATAERPTPQEVQAGLNRFRTKIRSQSSLVASYPMSGDLLRESDRVDVWRSQRDGAPVIVKMWKQASWGDLRKEGSRILAFLERAADLKADAPGGVPRVYEVLWLGDAFALVLEWIDGVDLATAMAVDPERRRTATEALSAVESMMDAVQRLHDVGFGHGDMKPENVVVRGDGGMILIDALDFSPLSDGEIGNGAYGGIGGDRFERDRAAILRICEEVFASASLDAADATAIAAAIEDCRAKEPRLATLLPLADALSELRERLDRTTAQVAPPTSLKLSIKGATPGLLESDEGRYYLRAYFSGGSRSRICIRGAAEEIEFRLDDRDRPVSAHRHSLSQTSIAIVSRHEILGFERPVVVSGAIYNDFSAFEEFLAEPEVAQCLLDVRRGGRGQDAAGDETVASEEETEELLAEETSADETLPDVVDVPLMWKELIASEKELVIEGVVHADSVFDRSINRHRVEFELQSGAFDFNRNDTVAVHRSVKGAWRRFGELDVARSTAGSVFIDASQSGPVNRNGVFEEGQHLRFVSHFEAESLRRRADAVDRILAGQGRAGALLSAFNPQSSARPAEADLRVDEADLASYGLNEDQVAAFLRIVRTRPMGLVQGPPGTGKTRFIAALAHYAITNGIARNVLLSSQSHEAVNTAAEALLRLFRQSGGEPSVVRVAMNEDQVSDPLRPYHTQRVEQSLRDRFRAKFQERMTVVAQALGVPATVVEEMTLYETAMKPIARRIGGLQGRSAESERSEGLRETLRTMIERLGLDAQAVAQPFFDVDEFEHEVLSLLFDRHAREKAVSPDKLNRLLEAVRIGSDFANSASRAQRSFEPFLAGTRQVVVGTCVGLGRTSLGLTNTAFDLVIVDEAARCTASELLVPLQAARWVVLVGDQAQLLPQHKAEVVQNVAKSTGIPKKEIQRSDFERVFSTTYGEGAGAQLQTQYRMLPPIGRLVSEVFYPDLRLKPGRHVPIVPPESLPADLASPLVWVETDSCGQTAFDRKESEGGSRINRVEAELVVETLERWLTHAGFEEWLAGQTDYPAGIGIICMYAAQRDLIHRKLLKSPAAEHLGRRIRVGTVDSYQGKENPIVMLSLVRNNAEGHRDGARATIREGFLVTPNRINVAVSRAMDRLVVFGAKGGWRKGGPMGRLASAFHVQEQEGTARTICGADILSTTGVKESVQRPAGKPARNGVSASG